MQQIREYAVAEAQNNRRSGGLSRGRESGVDYISHSNYSHDVVPAHIPEEGTEQVTEIPSTSGQPPPPSRLDFEALLCDLSAHFVKLSVGQADREIKKALARVRALLGADRCGLFKVFPETCEIELTHDSQADGVPAPSTRVGYAGLFPWSTNRYLRQGLAQQIHTRDFPPEASVDRASAESIGMKSFLSVPLLSEGGVRYVIASAAVREETVWPDECIPRLRAIGEIFVNTLERREAERSLRDSLEFERMISDLSARFVYLPAGAVDHEIEDSLSKVREFFGVDRCSLYEVFPETGEALLTHANHGEGVSPFPALVDFARFFPWTANRLNRREIVNLHTRDFPPEAAVDRVSSEALGIKSTLRIPLLSANTIRYVIVVSNVTDEKVWPEEYIPRLRLVGEIFVNALERKRADESLRQTLAFERLISELSARFVDIPFEEVDREIEHGLKQVRTFFDIDRCGLFESLPQIGAFRLTHSSLANGIAMPPREIDYFRIFPWRAEGLFGSDKGLLHQTRDYPPEAAVDRASAEAMGIKTSLVIPLSHHGAVRHMIAIHSVREEQNWREEYIPRFRLVGEILVNALERKRADESLRQTLEEAQQLRDRLQLENVYLREQLRPEDGQVDIVGESEVVRTMLAQARRVAPTDSTVLITGETGTGKELLAQAIHDMSARRGKTMLTVNCAALPPALIESELFGREKGAFTGATTRQIGRIEAADGSTLFLDEIGDLPVDLQVKLLRVLQDGRYERLGSHRTLTADVRVIAATHRDLAALVQAGRFREDLFHRLNVYPIDVPPLRDRVSDIPLLVWRFVQDFNRKMGKAVDSIPREDLERLKRYPWSGNVRELRNLVERAMIGCDGPSLKIEFPSEPLGPASAPVTMEQAERKHILDALERSRWRIRGPRGAAELLGLRPTTLYSRMKKLGISRPQP